MATYRVTREDGSVEYTDTPGTRGRIEQVRPGARRGEEPPQREVDPALAKDLIKEAQKRIPKIGTYLEYLDYLRHNSPIRFDQVLMELRREDPQTWAKLQKYPQFRPLRETVIGLKAGTNIMEASVNLVAGKITGSTEKWLESTLQSMMKRDRWGPYAEVLGAKATTLPTPTPAYSNSRLGQYLQVEDARLAAASRAAAKEVELAQAGARAARGASITRPGGVLVDLGLAALKPETGEAVTQTLLRARIEKAARRNPNFDIDTPAYEQARRLLSTARYGELDEFLKRYE